MYVAWFVDYKRTGREGISRPGMLEGKAYILYSIVW